MIETKIFDYGMNGEGVAKVDGKIVLVENALIDEVVDIEIVDEKENYATAKLNKIISKSSARQTPPCPYYAECGGCTLQHFNYDEQLKFKQLNIKKTIKKITGLDVAVNNTVACTTPFGYRNKMSFSVNSSKCGLLKANSKELVNISTCPLADNVINNILTLFKSFLETNKCDCVKNLVVRVIENQILVAVVTSKHIDLKDFFSILSSQFKNVGLYEIINTRNDSVVLSGKTIHIAGIKEIEISNSWNANSTKPLKYSVDLLGFHQTNIEIQNKLYEKVLNYVSPNTTIINGFSGQGLLSAILAQKAKQVIGIEINKSSHASAENLKKVNNINNLTNICGDFHKHITQVMNKANTIILDPTKKGCGKIVMNEIKGINNIIYISCNPIALCKDINVIKDDYEIEEITPFDMFPNTTSVETLVKLKKK